MSEKLSNRRETQANQYEESENYQAIRCLTEIGLLSRIDQTELYHGRAGDGSNNWQVRADFDNSGNKTGNSNINRVPALSTSDYKTAKDFAAARSWGGQTAEVHQITSIDQDAAVVDGNYHWQKLSSSEKNRAKAAIKATLPDIISGSPLQFENRDALNNLKPRDFRVHQNGLIYGEDIASEAKRLGLRESVANQVIASLNTKTLLSYYPEYVMNDVLSAFMNAKSYVEVRTTDNGKCHKIPINHEYLANWFRNIHTVGYKTKVWSATLGHTIENSLLFDLEKVNTVEAVDEQKRTINRRFGGLSLAIANQKPTSDSELLSTLIEHPYIEPQEIIKLAKNTPGFKEILESDAGNWEGFTLEEHTETVLKLFDDNYADLLPASTLPIMRLSLLSHDLGKAEATRRHDKANQKKYNIDAAERFLRENQIDDSTRKLVIAMIGDGMDYTTRFVINREKTAGDELCDYCEKTMKEYLNQDYVDMGSIFGLFHMMEVLQTCDSAAYTTMGVTRSKNRPPYRNAGSFNHSFEPFHGLTGHRAVLRR